MTNSKGWHFAALVAGLCFSDTLLAASCDYVVQNQWSTGFTAEITVINDGDQAIDSWSVNWEYSDGSAVTNLWSASLSGAGPYTASNESYNGNIAPGNSVSFGFNASKGSANAEAEIPTLSGICGPDVVNLIPIASFSSTVNSGAVPFDVTFDAQASTDPEGQALTYTWNFGAGETASGAVVTRTYSQPGTYSVSLVVNDGVSDSVPASSTIIAEDEVPLDAVYVLSSANSSLFFISAKNSHVVETHTFTALSGSISDLGVATLNINLDSIESGIAIRNERMRNFLFETTSFPQATVTLAVDLDALSAQAIGSAQTQLISASLNLHGFVNTLDTEVIVTKISATDVLVQNASPILLQAGDYGMESGIEALRSIAGLNIIGFTVPVNFTLLFTTPETTP